MSASKKRADLLAYQAMVIQSELNTSEKMFMISLAYRVMECNMNQLSYDQLTSDTGISKRHLTRMVKSLEQQNWITTARPRVSRERYAPMIFTLEVPNATMACGQSGSGYTDAMMAPKKHSTAPAAMAAGGASRRADMVDGSESKEKEVLTDAMVAGGDGGLFSSSSHDAAVSSPASGPSALGGASTEASKERAIAEPALEDEINDILMNCDLAIGGSGSTSEMWERVKALHSQARALVSAELVQDAIDSVSNRRGSHSLNSVLANLINQHGSGDKNTETTSSEPE